MTFGGKRLPIGASPLKIAPQEPLMIDKDTEENYMDTTESMTPTVNFDTILCQG